MNTKQHTDLTPVLLWSTRIVVAALGLLVPLLGSPLELLSTPARLITTLMLWALWATSLLCILVPSSISLTALRLGVPVLSVIIVAVAVAHSWSAEVAIALVLAIIATVLVFSAEVGNYFVQLTAYGDEQRFLLRCPASLQMVQILSWLTWVALGVSTVSALAAKNYIIAVLAAGGVAALSYILPRRFHRFSRRWLVSVPAGLVLHDHVMLAETAMFMRTAVTAVTVIDKDVASEMADMSGKCSGLGLGIVLKDFDTVVMAGTAKNPGGSAIHVKSLWVCPTRPGRALSATMPPPTTNRSSSS